jgi:hypothetical protein
MSFKTCLKHYIDYEWFRLFVYDNSLFPKHKSGEFEKSNIEYISDKTNPGLSKAYNIAAFSALKNRCEWMLILDQDTLFPDEKYIFKCIDCIKQNININLFVSSVWTKKGRLISPFKVFCNFPITTHFKSGGIYNVNKYSFINSGIVIKTNAYWEIGGYNELVFLDFSDMQFINRYKKHYTNFYLLEYKLMQDFSNDEVNIKKSVIRFGLFCTCARNYEKKGLLDHISFLLLVIKHAISMFLRTGNFSIISLFFKKYFF